MNFPGAPFDPGAGGTPGTRQYVYRDSRIVLAVNVALAARRPLLVTGDPGSGKSTLAADVATRLGWAFVGETITSRTRQDDLVARIDSVRRLADAQARSLRADDAYLIPGALWWAFDGDSAVKLAAAAGEQRTNPDGARHGVVVLLDEIDKAEPDLPNDLLAPLDSYTIRVSGRAPIQAASDVLMVITSNGERAMPPAFLRRCITLELGDDDPGFPSAVAVAHLGERDDTLYDDIAARLGQLSQAAASERRRRPSIAEYLDTVRAAVRFGQRPPTDTSPGTPLWLAIEEAALGKSRAGNAGAGRG